MNMHVKKHLFYLWLQIKTALLLLPRILLTLFLFSFLLLSIVFLGTKLLYQGEAFQKVPIAVVLPAEDSIASLAFAFLENMESVKESCQFIRTDREDALLKLQHREVYAAVLIPENLVENIQSGRNTPVTIFLPSAEGIDSLLFCTLADAGISILRAAQAGIYAVDEILVSAARQDLISEAEAALNKRYFSYGIKRSTFFYTEEVSATGALSIAEFYLCSGVLFLFLFSGIAAFSFLKKESPAFFACQKRIGLSAFYLRLCKWFSLTTAYMMLFLLSLLLYKRRLVLQDLLSLFLLCGSIISFLSLLFHFTSQITSAVLSLSVFTVGAFFCSGALIPASFLPDALTRTARFLPTTLWLLQAGELLGSNVCPGTCLLSLVTIICFLGAETLFTSITAFLFRLEN